jgi:K+-transporting ATPase ATPase A chain
MGFPAGIRDAAGFALFLAATGGAAWALSGFLVRALEGEARGLLGRAERGLGRLVGADLGRPMDGWAYARALLVFNGLGILLLTAILTGQRFLPLNPEGLPGMAPLPALHAAISFVTNTNWQAYAGETTLSPFSQAVGLSVQNFLSAATGLAAAFALIRGLARSAASREEALAAGGLGNFWRDLLRGTLAVLLPLALLWALALAQQGVPQSAAGHWDLQVPGGGTARIASGPVASQEAIKELGTNGGGFFGANSAHPLENPTPLTNLLECAAILLLPAAGVLAFGRRVRDVRQGLVLAGAMGALLLLCLGGLYAAESAAHPLLASLGVSGPGFLEGKEVRFGPAGSSLFATLTTAASCGAVNCAHDSLSPLGGMTALLQILLGEVIFGGVGAGFIGMILFVLLTVFLVGLMVGRTPEYLGKRIESFEMSLAVLAILLPSLAILLGSAVATVLPQGASAAPDPGPHGLTEILYAFASASQNNGSAFGGLAADRPFYEIGLSLCMLVGRFGTILPVLAIADRMARKRPTPAGPGTFPTTGPLFGVLLVSVVLIVGGLTYMPVLTLGPILEHLSLAAGRAF